VAEIAVTKTMIERLKGSEDLNRPVSAMTDIESFGRARGARLALTMILFSENPSGTGGLT
jgi:hypothetical protein